jgi:hypothetical protein
MVERRLKKGFPLCYPDPIRNWAALMGANKVANRKDLATGKLNSGSLTLKRVVSQRKDPLPLIWSDVANVRKSILS